MSPKRPRRRNATAATPAKPPSGRPTNVLGGGRHTPAAAPLSATKRRLFYTLTLLAPVLILGALEVVLRLTWSAGALPLFVKAPLRSMEALTANPRVARRWFAAEATPPAPMPEPFATLRPGNAFRVFVLGESSAAGFPYPRNGTFSRVLRDALRDVLPRDSVEVVNLGIAATSSFTMSDIVDEVIAQRPDAVIVYAGHNEYYGALAVSSREGVGLPPRMTRAYLKLLRLRAVLGLRTLLVAVRRRLTGSALSVDESSLMESLARDRSIPYGSTQYERGIRQLEANLRVLLHDLHGAGVPVLIGSPASNLRDQAPFPTAANQQAAAAFAKARELLARGDTLGARPFFVRARDLDVVRFRAPSAFDSIVRQTARSNEARYVPVAEGFAAAAPGGIPGRDLFLEHVHPNRTGYALLARLYFEALRDAGFFGHRFDLARLRPWTAYEAGMELTPFDERVAFHTVQTLVSRWPFVPVTEQRDYRATYRPTDLLDSLAFLVSRGARWETSKLQLAASYERRGRTDSAVAEYRGLVRDAPFFEEPHRLLGRALLAADRLDAADSALRRARSLTPTGYGSFALGLIALRRHDQSAAIELLRESLRLQPDNPPALYQLSLALGLSRDLAGARATAIRLQQVAPNYPGLSGWMQTIGLR